MFQQSSRRERATSTHATAAELTRYMIERVGEGSVLFSHPSVVVFVGLLVGRLDEEGADAAGYVVAVDQLIARCREHSEVPSGEDFPSPLTGLSPSEIATLYDLAGGLAFEVFGTDFGLEVQAARTKQAEDQN